jgi:hypothetical protein
MAGGLVYFNSKLVENDLRELMRMYGALPVGLKRKHIRAAMNRGLKPFLKDFRKAAPKRTGKLRRSVKISTSFGRVDGSWSSRIGYSRKRGGGHAVLVAYGTKNRETKDGESRGRMPANRSLGETADRIRRAGLPELYSQLGIALERAIKELPTYMLKSAKSRAKRGR